MTSECPVTIESQILKLLQEVGGLDEDDDMARLPALVDGLDEDEGADVEEVGVVDFRFTDLVARPPSPPPTPTPPSPPDSNDGLGGGGGVRRPVKKLSTPGPKIPLPGLREVRPVNVLVIKNMPWVVDLREVEEEIRRYARSAGSDLVKPLLAVWEMGMVLAELTKSVSVRPGQSISVQGHNLTLEPSKNPCMEQPAPSQVVQLKCLMLSPDEDYTPLNKEVKESFRIVTSDAERKISGKAAVYIADNVDREWLELAIPDNSFRSTRNDGTTRQRKYCLFSMKLPTVEAAIAAKDCVDGKIVEILGLKLVIRIDFARVNSFSLKAPADGDTRVKNGSIGEVNASKGLMETFFPFHVVKPVAAQGPLQTPSGSKKSKKTAKKMQQQLLQQQQHTQQQQILMQQQIAKNMKLQQPQPPQQRILPVPVPVHSMPTTLLNQSFLQGVSYALSHPVFTQQFQR
eukprot:TRINITY_DN698_c0_g1_i1.p1 TRINITY_DN698_c0_g1~~TRINITY_DN698_c0_g1_i1.p1  ORF type:complete len:458 (+),score=98.36 TRINITY_DN698_c0_g1_i1:293-1666(+)